VQEPKPKPEQKSKRKRMTSPRKSVDCASGNCWNLEAWDRTAKLDLEIDAELMRMANRRIEESGMVELE
jgi:hypothetical protein